MHKLGALALLVLPTVALSQWTYVPSSTTAELRGLSLAGDRVAWASGARGTIVRSIDGGQTWTADTIVGATHLDLRSVHALDGRVAVVASAGEAEKGLAQIYSTSDSAGHWRRVFSTGLKGVFLDAIAFWNPRHGVAVSDPVEGRFFVLTTDDSGATWSRVDPTRLPPVLPGEAAFAASGSALVVTGSRDVWIGTGGGGRARVFHSSDRGLSWTVADTPVHAEGGAAGIFSLAFHDASHGVAVGGDYTKPTLAATSVAVTEDGGRTWTAADHPPAAYLSGVAYAGSARRLVAVGLAGTFTSRDGGRSWARGDTVALNAVRFAGSRGVAVGPRGRAAWMEARP